MLQRILRAWNLRRAVYLAIGILMTVQFIQLSNVPGILLGLYFTSMGLFAFGCASGNCFGNDSANQDTRSPDIQSINIDYEEIKNK